MQFIMRCILGAIPFCLIGLVAYFVFGYLRYRKAKVFNWKREMLVGLFVAYCLGVASQTILPYYSCGIDIETGEISMNACFSKETVGLNLVPFQTIIDQFLGVNPYVMQEDIISVSVLYFASNICLFIPLGIFIPLVWPRINNAKAVVCIGIGISLLKEIIQFFVGRSTDIDDLLLNTLGVVIGYFLYKLFGKASKSRSEN